MGNNFSAFHQGEADQGETDQVQVECDHGDGTTYCCSKCDKAQAEDLRAKLGTQIQNVESYLDFQYTSWYENWSKRKDIVLQEQALEEATNESNKLRQRYEARNNRNNNNNNNNNYNSEYKESDIDLNQLIKECDIQIDKCQSMAVTSKEEQMDIDEESAWRRLTIRVNEQVKKSGKNVKNEVLTQSLKRKNLKLDEYATKLEKFDEKVRSSIEASCVNQDVLCKLLISIQCLTQASVNYQAEIDGLLCLFNVFDEFIKSESSCELGGEEWKKVERKNVFKQILIDLSPFYSLFFKKIAKVTAQAQTLITSYNNNNNNNHNSNNNNNDNNSESKVYDAKEDMKHEDNETRNVSYRSVIDKNLESLMETSEYDTRFCGLLTVRDKAIEDIKEVISSLNMNGGDHNDTGGVAIGRFGVNGLYIMKSIQDACIKIITSQAAVKQSLLLAQELYTLKPQSSSLNDNERVKFLWDIVDNGMKNIHSNELMVNKGGRYYFDFLQNFGNSFDYFLNKQDRALVVSTENIAQNIKQFGNICEKFGKNIELLNDAAMNCIESFVNLNDNDINKAFTKLKNDRASVKRNYLKAQKLNHEFIYNVNITYNKDVDIENRVRSKWRISIKKANWHQNQRYRPRYLIDNLTATKKLLAEQIDIEWSKNLYNQDAVDNMEDLSHESNLFVKNEKIDLNNEIDTRHAVDSASRRAFGDDYIGTSKPEIKIIDGEFQVMVPNGDIRTRVFKNEKVVKSNMLFKVSNEDDTNDDNKQDSKQADNKDKVESCETQLFYDPNGFKPIINICERNGIIMKPVLTNEANNNNNNIDKIEKAKQKLIKKSEERLTTQCVKSLQSQNVSITKFEFKRKVALPPMVIQKCNVNLVSEAARESNRVFFTGLVVGGKKKDMHISKVFEIDEYSEYVGQGFHPSNKAAFPKAVKSTFDGIAIDKNTRIIIYEKENYQGKVLCDKTGPAIINNLIWKHDDRYNHVNTQIYDDPKLQANFPCHVRVWSDTNMHNWSHGSLRIISQGQQN